MQRIPHNLAAHFPQVLRAQLLYPLKVALYEAEIHKPCVEGTRVNEGAAPAPQKA
jgi:hypothetical protein